MSERDIDGANRTWVQPSDVSPGRWGSLLFVVANVVFIGSGSLLAWRNARLGRGDRKTAFRVAAYFFALNMLHWTFGAHHVLERSEAQILYGGLYVAFFYFGLAWIFYMALEPFVRRLWPRILVSWIRLMEGRMRDPLVGRHVLLGCVFGVGFAIWAQLGYPEVHRLFGRVPPRPHGVMFHSEVINLHGVRHSLAQLFNVHSNVMITLMFFLVGILLLRMLLRRDRLAFAAAWLLLGFIYYPRGGEPVLGMLMGFVFFGIILSALARVGFLSVLIAQTINDVLRGWPLNPDTSVWYGPLDSSCADVRCSTRSVRLQDLPRR